MKKNSVLGDISPETFLKKYWQKKPLLIRQAIPAMQAPVTRDELFELAARDDVESRLIAGSGKRWRLEHGPFPSLPSLRKKNWTVLVQGVNLHNDLASALMHQFRFVPNARLDDLMISYATDGGGVGPHFDSYDVFLLQAHGKRHWRISAQKDLSLKPGLPLRILDHFVPEQEFVLEPGDMLYLPPSYAHDGVAVGECMTYSIGFRAPSWQELGVAFLEFRADTLEMPGRYADPGLKPSRHPAKLDDDMLARVDAQLQKMRSSREDITIFLGEYLSEPKPTVMFDPPSKAVSLERFRVKAAREGVRLHRKTRMLYRGKYLFINGESFQAAGDDRQLLSKLADERSLDPTALAKASDDLMESLHQWHGDGWLITN